MAVTDAAPAAPKPDAAASPAAKPDKLALMVEAKRRGILPANKQGLYDEALRRGLLPGVKATDSGTSPAPFKEIGSELAAGARTTAGEVEQGLHDLEGRDRSVDYSKGAGYTTELGLKEADNPAEARAVLEKIYGKGNAGQDRAGNWWIKKGGKKISVYGDDSGLLKRAATSAQSEAPTMAGMTTGEMIGGGLGTAAGVESGPGALATGTFGAILGGELGKGMQDFWKWTQGTLRKSPSEEISTLKDVGIATTLGTLGGRALTRLGGYLLRPKEIPWIHVTPEMEDRVIKTTGLGMVPRIDQATGGKTYRLFIMDQRLMHYIWGDPNVVKNVEALNRQLEINLKKAGVPADKIQPTMDHIIKRDVPTTDINHDIVKAVNEYREGIERTAGDGAKTATKALDQDFIKINKSLIDPKVNLSDAVEGDIARARKDFGTTSGGLYQTADELAGGRKLVESSDIKAAVNAIIEKIPKTEGTPPVEKYVRDAKGFLRKQVTPGEGGRMLGTQVESPVMAYIKDMLKLPDKITLADASRIRSSLLALTRDPGLTPGVGWRELNQIASSVDVSIDKVALNAEDKPVIDALHTANDYYKRGIAKFEDVTANRLVKEAGQRGAVEPEMVMNTIIRPGKVAQAQRIMKLLQPDTQHQLARDYWQSIIQRTTNPAMPDKLNGKGLLSFVNKKENAEMMRAVLGNDVYDKMVTLAKNTAGLDESIPISELGSDGGAAAVKAALKAKKAVDSFMDEHYLRSLAKPGPNTDTAFNFVTEEGHVERLKAAMTLFGKDSPIAGQIRQKLMAKILSSSVAVSNDPAEQLFAGNALKNTLTKYGREFLTEAYGEDMTNDLFTLADTVATISGKPTTGGAVGFVAGVHIMLSPLKHIGTLVGAGIMNKAMASPIFIKWLILGFKGDNMAIKTVNQMMRQLVNLAAQGAVPNTSEESPADQKAEAFPQ